MFGSGRCYRVRAANMTFHTLFGYHVYQCTKTVTHITFQTLRLGPLTLMILKYL